MSRSIHAMPRLTPDVTYRGLPLPSDSYKIHLRILKAIDAGTWMQEDISGAPWPEYTAFMAIKTGGLIKEATTRFRGNYELTPYGRVYLAQGK